MQNERHCPQCGMEADGSEAFCPKCHYDYEEQDNWKDNAPIEKIVFLGIILVFAIVVAILYFFLTYTHGP